eukprot:764443-Hanusia_phi.AAC.8
MVCHRCFPTLRPRWVRAESELCFAQALQMWEEERLSTTGLCLRSLPVPCRVSMTARQARAAACLTSSPEGFSAPEHGAGRCRS